MSVRIPTEVREEISQLVYEKADAHRYLEKGRVENGIFMNNLVNDPEIGGRLSDYMPPDKVKTYIKDAILNRYSKLRRQLPRNVDDMICAEGQEVYEVEYNSRDNVSLHRIGEGEYVVVARINPLKWETGLRKLIVFAARCPGLKEPDTKTSLTLIIFESGTPINGAEKELIEAALAQINVHCIWG